MFEDLAKIDPNSRTQLINFHHFDTFNTKSEEEEHIESYSQNQPQQYTQEMADSANFIYD